jgi:hypothetical protein
MIAHANTDLDLPALADRADFRALWNRWVTR